MNRNANDRRHSTADGRGPECQIRHSSLVIRHSSLVTLHSSLCIVLAALLAANARAAEVAKFVEYIETDGSASTPGEYILLDYTPTDASVVEADVAILDKAKTHAVFCSRSSGESRTFTCFYIGNTGFRWDYNTTQNSTGKKVTSDERHTIRCASTGFYFDDDLVKSVTPGSFTPGNRMALFASYNNQTAPTTPTPSDNFAKMRLYSFKAWDDGGATLKVDLRPVVDTEDEPALLDLVTGTLYYNLKAGMAFTPGPDVNPPPEYAIALAASYAPTNGVWYATVSIERGSGEVSLNVASPQGATNVVSLSNGVATAPATFTAAIPGLAADTIYSVFASFASGTDTNFTRAVSILNGPVSVAVTANATSATPGAFTVSRASTADATWLPLKVPFTLTGTAVAGTHCTALPSSVTIPAGAASASVEVRALSKETASTSLTLTLSDGDYFIGNPSSATMSIDTVFAEKIVRVAPGGTGDGSSWASPMGSVANAYAAAAAFVEGGGGASEVWVRTGRYTISSTITVKSGVSVRGGFLGTETDASQASRDNLTILSGDKNDDDYWLPCGTNTAEKLYVWTGTDKMTFNPPAPRDPDEYWTLSNGGANNYYYGFQTLAGTPVTNCTFAGLTFTSFRTCPLYMLDGGPHVGVAVTNCNFWACGDNGSAAFRVTAAEARVSDNLCWGAGSGILVKTPATVACTNEIAGCVFRDITPYSALYLQAGTTNNTWRVKNCGFHRNRTTSVSWAPAVHLSGNKTATRLEMTDCYIRECILTGTCLGLVQPDDGGASHTFLFKDCDFLGNIRTNSTSGTACFTGCKIGKNWFFDGCSFRGNRLWYGGTDCAASVYRSVGSNQYATFLNCSFETNAVVSMGETPAKAAATLSIPIDHTRLFVINCLLDGNKCSGALTNADIHTVAVYNATVAIVNSVLHSDDPDYAPLRSGLGPYLYRSWLSNFDKDAVGCASWSRYADVSTGGDPDISEKLRAKAGSPHRIRGLWVDSPFWRSGTEIWLRERKNTYPHVYLRNSSGKNPWHPINHGYGENDQSDATMATWGITVDSPLIPDAIGNRRKTGKVAYGPIGYAHPAVMVVR